MPKKPKREPRTEKETPRFLARGLGYSASKFVGDDAGSRHHWVTQEPEAVSEDWQQAESRRVRGRELEREDAERKARIELEREVAKQGGQSALRQIKQVLNRRRP